MFRHQCYFYLILNFFYTGSVIDTHTTKYIGNDILCRSIPTWGRTIPLETAALTVFTAMNMRLTTSEAG